MRLISYIKNNQKSFAVSDGNRFIDLSEHTGTPIEKFSEAITLVNNISEELVRELKTAPALPSDIKYALPVDAENKVICVGLNYLDHAKEGGFIEGELPKHPVFFLRLNSSFVADNEGLILPKVSDKYDYEAELAIVIGRTGRHIGEADVQKHIFGYTLGMDGSVRDFQKRTPQWTLGKNFDKSGALSGNIITKDELPENAEGLRITSKLNGNIMQDGNTENTIYKNGLIISELSSVMTLNAGDIILTGTPAGVGFARNPRVFMKAGDLVEVEIEKIGLLRNKVIAE